MTSDDDDDGESFFTYGEPLDDDEDGPKLNLTAVENQVVQDAQGRRRFHGAFTGGFSAGYFNSVGSKEGWTPSTFVSSRSNKNEGKKNQTAEDFMDDEDLGEYGIAPRKLKTADKFTSSARVPKRSGDDEASTIPGLAPLDDLVTVTNASIGAQILRRMGWREGQGVGPKVRKYKKKKKNKGKLGNNDEQGGESIPTSEAEKCEDDMSNFLFGPDDVQQFLFQMKSDQKGLGYSGINRDTSVLGGHMNLFGDAPSVKGKRKGIKGSAFGIGAFEEQDDDIYSTDDMNMYDQVLGGEDQSEKNFGWTAPKTTVSSQGCLDGFTAARQTKALVKKVFAPPILPSGFQPLHTFSEVEPPKEEERYSRFSLSSTQRSAMLGEEVLQGKPTTPESKLSDRQEARMEYGRDEKQQPNTKHEGDEQSISQGITEWERQRGRSELTRAAGLHKPVSSMMASRFVSAQYKDEEVVEYGETNQEDKSQHENAAEMKMYGKLTRELFEWHPDNILCKRFNVPNPYPGSSLVGVPTMQKEKVSVYNFLTKTTSLDAVSVPAITAPTPISVTSERSDNGSLAPQSESSKRKKKSRWDIKPAILSIIEERRKNVTLDKSEPETNEEGEEETENRPPRDLFNAIFNESDSSDSESSGSDSGRDDDDQEGKTKGSEEPEDEIPVKDEKDPGKLDANFLEKNSRDGEDQSKEYISEEDELYGPALPPASSLVPTHVHSSGRDGASISEAGKKHSRHSHGSRHRKKHHGHSSESRSSSKKNKSQSSSRKEKKRKRRKEKKHRKESHRGRSSKDKQKKRSKSSDSSYSSASEG